MHYWTVTVLLVALVSGCGRSGMSTLTCKKRRTDEGRCSWRTEVIHAGAGIGAYNSIALDHRGQVHIAYYDGQHRRLMYTTNRDCRWSREVVTGKFEGLLSSLALDQNGVANLLYSAKPLDTVHHAVRENAGWKAAPVPKGYTKCLLGDFTLDVGDRAHFSCTGTETRHYSNRGGKWNSSATGDHSAHGSSSIALDSAGFPHLTYFRNKWGLALMHATVKGGSWINAPIDKTGVVYWSSMALDSHNRVHVAYFLMYQPGSFASFNDLMYAVGQGGKWQRELVDDHGGRYPSMKLDSAGHAHLSYCDGTAAFGEPLIYTTNRSGKWTRTTIDAGPGFTCRYSSIAVDHNDNVHISYNNMAKELRYATSSCW